MTPNQILIVVVRLIAVMWALYVVSQIGPIVSASEQMGIGPSASWALLAVQFFFCVFLWFFPASFASKLLRGSRTSEVSPSSSISDWQELAFVAVGVFVLSRAIPDILYWLIFFFGAAISNTSLTYLTLEQKVMLPQRSSTSW